MAQATPTLAEQEDAVDESVDTKTVRGNRRCHMTLQAKGGIGKSHVARLLCEYFAEAGAYDLDVQNKTLSKIKPLNASVVKVTGSDVTGTTSQVDVDALDQLVNLIVQSDDHDIVLDTGNWMYGHMLDFLETSNIIHWLNVVKREVWFHLIACGGPMQTETMSDIERLVDRWAGRVRILLWDNEYHGPIQGAHGNGLIETDTYQKQWKNRVVGVVKLTMPKLLFQNDVKSVQASNSTYQAVIGDPSWPVSKRSRIHKVWLGIQTQLDAYFASDRFRAPSIPTEAVQELSAARQQATADVHEYDPSAMPQQPDGATKETSMNDDTSTELDGDQTEVTPAYVDPPDPNEDEYSRGESGDDDEIDPDMAFHEDDTEM